MLKNHTINETCQIARISRAMLYKLLKLKRGPKVTKIGRRSFVSSESLAIWLKQMEQLSMNEKEE